MERVTTMNQTLVLDLSYRPVARETWKTAIVKVLVDRVAEVVDEYPDKYIRTPNWQVKMPSVIRLLKPVPRKKAIKFSRHNVWLRDGGRCQYCGHRVARDEFTYEHVVPRAQGGKTCWDNVVVACHFCNQRKGGRTPQQAGMPLHTVPVRPKKLPDIAGASIPWREGMPEGWRAWLRSVTYWEGALTEE